MSSNYPPGVTGAIHRNVYRIDCKLHGEQYVTGWDELGGTFLDDDQDAIPTRLHVYPSGQRIQWPIADEWNYPNVVCDCVTNDEGDYTLTEVHAHRCDAVVFQATNPHDGLPEHTVLCGLWVPEPGGSMYADDDDVMTVFGWVCEDGHETETEE